MIGREHGPYFGRVFSDLELDARSLNTIPAKLMKGEAELFTVKNPMYRGLHPMAATMLFAEKYEAAYKWMLRRREDYRFVKTFRVFSAVNPMDDTEQNKVGLWAARRAADSMGADYETFCFNALDYSERAGWKKLALPRELANANVKAAVAAKSN